MPIYFRQSFRAFKITRWRLHGKGASPSSRKRPLSSAFKCFTALIYELDNTKAEIYKCAGLEISGLSHDTIAFSPDFSKPWYFEISPNLNQSPTSLHQSNTVILPPNFSSLPIIRSSLQVYFPSFGSKNQDSIVNHQHQK